ncbi:hypothetical protein HAX54_037439 [Datura stramonium]|uniref:Uncharacterized protein n=1 Tax=Datura stramonium TaxID=4076 RepID=A0ABS8VJH0_DATST|nr:hypothetical protein [Datura stramonium]
MSLESFQKYMKCDKIKLLTFKEDTGASLGFGSRDFVVELKEMPGVKSLQRTKCYHLLKGNSCGAFTLFESGKTPSTSLTLSGSILLRYGGADEMVFDFEWHLVIRWLSISQGKRVIKICEKSWVGKLPEYPNPAASKISSRVMVELGMLTAVMTAAAVIVGAFLASAVFAVSHLCGILERVWDKVVDVLLVEEFSPSCMKCTLVVDIWQGIEFSQSKPQARVDVSFQFLTLSGVPAGVTFNDVAGIEEAVEELPRGNNLVRYLKNPELFDKMGIQAPTWSSSGGTSWTMARLTLVAKAIAGEAGVPFYQMAGSEFVEVLVGVGSARIRDLFKRAKVNRPSVIFISQKCDALATRGHKSKGLLDPALLRLIRIRPPNAKGRLEILKVHARKVKLSNTVDLASYAQNLPGWSGAKLAQLLQEAALVAVRRGHNSILQPDMDDAVDTTQAVSSAITEVGTALTSHLLRQYENAEVERCDRISINPRGQTLSQAVFHRLDDESYMFDGYPQFAFMSSGANFEVFLGGRAAEEVIYGRDTSRASVNYLADASWLARKIITIWNMKNPMAIHGEPPPWIKRVRFVGPRLDFGGSLYDDYDLTEPPINFNLDDDVAKKTEELIRDICGKTVTLLRQHDTALLKTSEGSSESDRDQRR